MGTQTAPEERTSERKSQPQNTNELTNRASVDQTRAPILNQLSFRTPQRPLCGHWIALDHLEHIARNWIRLISVLLPVLQHVEANSISRY